MSIVPLRLLDRGPPLTDPGRLRRTAIVRSYAKQLGPAEAAEVARSTGGLSGRDLRDIACRTERAWANKVMRNADECLPLHLGCSPLSIANCREWDLLCALVHWKDRRSGDAAPEGCRSSAYRVQSLPVLSSVVLLWKTVADQNLFMLVHACHIADHPG